MNTQSDIEFVESFDSQEVASEETITNHLSSVERAEINKSFKIDGQQVVCIFCATAVSLKNKTRHLGACKKAPGMFLPFYCFFSFRI